MEHHVVHENLELEWWTELGHFARSVLPHKSKKQSSVRHTAFEESPFAVAEKCIDQARTTCSCTFSEAFAKSTTNVAAP